MFSSNAALAALIPTLWWFRDGHKLEGATVCVNGTIVSQSPVTNDTIMVYANNEAVPFLLTEPSANSRERFWYLPENQIRGIQIKYPAEPEPQESSVALNAAFGGPQMAQIFMQIHDWSLRQPAPPVANIERVSGFGATAYNYFCNGASDFRRFVNLARYHGIDPLASGARVLDWGAGCGRLTRWFAERGKADVVGIDVDADNIAWCRHNLRGASFDTVDLYPPTKFQDAEFNMIFANSVLTHLTKSAMNLWLAEVRRLLKPEGVALLSFHGDFSNAFFVSRYPEAMQKILETGFYDDQVGKEMAGVLADPNYYRQTYMSDKYARSMFSAAGFDLVEVVVGHVSRCQNLAVLKLAKQLGRNSAISGMSESVPPVQRDIGPADARDDHAKLAHSHYQSAKPEVNMTRTVVFFDQLISQSPGAEGGSVQLRENGILLHPGEKEATEVLFNITGEKKTATLAAWIAPLPVEALANEQAGVAALQLFLDDRPLPRVQVSRHDNAYFTFETTGASKLKIVADSANGTALFDWLFIGVK